MKKGDVIQQRKDIAKGKCLMHNLSSLEEAERQIKNIGNYYNLPASAQLVGGFDELNPGMFGIIADADTYVTVEAKVNWVVDNEISVTYVDSGACAILDMNEEENQGWIVIKSATPTYQSDVEHMSDEELRASIEALRMQRLTRPAPKTRTRSTTPKQPAMSAQEKALANVMKTMSPDEQLALKRKLGLI